MFDLIGLNCLKRAKSRKESVVQKWKEFIKSELGATSIEYGLIAALIAIVIISAVTATGGAVSNTFNTVSGSF